MEACECARVKGVDAPFDRFFATVSNDKSRLNLLNKFSSYQNRFRAYCGENDLWMDAADVIILAFKPCLVEEILSQKCVRDALAGKLVISVIVGVSHQRLSNAIFKPLSSIQNTKKALLSSDVSHAPPDKPAYLKRIMMNIDAEYGQCITVIESPPPSNHNTAFENLTKWIFEKCGKIFYMEEDDFEIGGVLSSASVALLSVAFDGMLDGAVSQGLKRAQAKEIVTQSLISLATLLQNDTHPAVLRENFSTPQGITIAGLMSLEEDRTRWAYCKAIIASSERSKKIG